jgi:hypothetical protein
MPPSLWNVNGSTAVVSSGCASFGNVTAQYGNQFLALLNGSSSISQQVYVFPGSRNYDLTFYAMNGPGFPGGLAPLDISVDGAPIGTVSPLTVSWTFYQLQFSVGLATTSFSLSFKVNAANNGRTAILLDRLLLLSDADCELCYVFSCAPGTYLSATGCGGFGSCLPCPAGSYCPGVFILVFLI